MRVIGLELSDAGIMAAVSGADGPLRIDGDDPESPGFALSEKNRIWVGGEAAQKAHLYPRYVLHTYWDRLDTKPLKAPGFEGKTHAEIAYVHFERLWNTVKHHGDALVVAVPEYFTPEQLGLILGMAKELAAPVIGFVPLAMAASSTPYPGRLLIAVDMHLHRTVVTALSQTDRLYVLRTETLPGKGLHTLYAEFADMVAAAFVRQTRYDPFHQADSEQHLYNRLPGLLNDLQQNATAPFQMRAGGHVHGIVMSREPLLESIEPVVDEICRVIEDMRKAVDAPAASAVVQLTHRAHRIFGFKDLWAVRPGMAVATLAPGAAAVGALNLAGRFKKGAKVSLLSSRPWPNADSPMNGKDRMVRPTHVLLRHIAYPLSQRGLAIGAGPTSDAPEILFEEGAGRSGRWGKIRLQGEGVVLEANSSAGIFVDGVRVTDRAMLGLGQIIRIENHAETLRLIACINET